MSKIKIPKINDDNFEILTLTEIWIKAILIKQNY